MLKQLLKATLTVLILFKSINAFALENCNWDNREGIPCLTINKTSNTSDYNRGNIIKKVFNRQQIESIGAQDTFDLIKLIPGLDFYQSGQKGQTGAVFMRGSESNHTLVTLNGIPSLKSTTNGIHDFGQSYTNYSKGRSL